MTNRKIFNTKPFCFPVQSVTWVYKYRLPLNWCDDFISFAEKNVLSKTLRNVRSSKSTGWKLNEAEGFEKNFQPFTTLIVDYMKNAFSTSTGVPCNNEMSDIHVKNAFIVQSLWVSWFDEKGYTWPHHHFSDYYGSVGAFSFSAYLGDVETSISFQDPLTTTFHTVDVSKGDVLFFPSDLVHMSFDVSPGRIICSGNLHMFIEPSGNNEVIKKS
jgi:hypothetical protein